MKVISFNVNGLRSILSKDKSGSKDKESSPSVLDALIKDYEPDVLCLQECKCPEDLKVHFDELPFKRILSSKTRKGYSGVAIFSRTEPVKFYEDFPLNDEGRVLVAEYPSVFVMNAYIPNSKPDLSRLEYRVQTWEEAVLKYVKELQKKKPVIYVGDLNVAHQNIDVHNPKSAQGSHGFTDSERMALGNLFESATLVDSYRVLHPSTAKYSWFSPFAKSRERNKGWRIDYQLISAKLKSKIIKADILSDYYGSDHVPTYLEICI